jgi:chemotaxis protein CheY-P-specific phosphatase CheC
MPHDLIQDALSETLIQSLETMAFLPAEPVETPADMLSDPVSASLQFSGDFSGRIRVVTSRDFTLVLAASVLGTDPSDADAHEKADDCLKELVNVLAGALMPRIARSENDRITLSLPTIDPVEFQTDHARLKQDAITRCFDVDGHGLIVQLIDHV